MITHFVFGLANDMERLFNRNMSHVGIDVKHNYGQLKQYKTLQDSANKFKIQNSKFSYPIVM